MRLIHRQNGVQSTLTSNVGTTGPFLSQIRGLISRGSIPDDYAPVFRFDDADHHGLHMVFIPFDIDALWLVDDEVTKKKRLSA